MFEDKEEYIKARAECKAKITKVIKVWSAEEETIHDVSFQEGAKLGFQECAKSRLNITSISDCPIKEDDKLQQAMKQIHSLLYVYQLGKNELATARIRAEAEQFLKDNNYFN